MTTLLARDPRAPFTLTPALPGRDTAIRKSDRVLTASALLLALIGALLVWAATRDIARANGDNPQGYLYRHLINIAIASVLFLAASRLDARLLRLFGPIVYALSIVGLLAVFVIGTTVNGAHAWIRIGGGLELQPSEFMKLGMIVGLAVLFSERASEHGRWP